MIGRNRTCDLVMENPRVSGEHASLRWTGTHWEIRDLGSRNGTYVDGQKLGHREWSVVDVGSMFRLGQKGPGFLMVDASPPIASARSIKTGAVRRMAGSLLVLPGDEAPWVTIYEDRSGRWVAEEEEPGSIRNVSDRELLDVRGEGWLLDLPGGAPVTQEMAAAELTVDNVLLRFGVSMNEEHVEVSVIHENSTTRLASRSFHYLLLTLARVRLADATLPESEQGWVDRDKLCKMLSTDPIRLNVDVYRTRRQLGTLGFDRAAELIARRPGTRQIRLGITRVEVVKL